MVMDEDAAPAAVQQAPGLCMQWSWAIHEQWGRWALGAKNMWTVKHVLYIQQDVFITAGEDMDTAEVQATARKSTNMLGVQHQSM